MKKVKIYRLQKWIRIYWFFLVGISFFIFFISQCFITNGLTNDKENEVRGVVQVLGKSTEHSLNIVDSFIYETFSDSMDLYTIIHGNDTVEKSFAYSRILKSMESIQAWSEVTEAIVFYAPTAPDRNSISVGDSSSYNLRKQVITFLESNTKVRNVQKNLVNAYGYRCFYEGDTVYITRIIKIKDCYFSICISEDKILEYITSEIRGEGITFIADKGGNVVSRSKRLVENAYIKDDVHYIAIENELYLQTGYFSENTGFYIGVLTKKKDIVSQLFNFRITYILICLS